MQKIMIVYDSESGSTEEASLILKGEFEVLNKHVMITKVTNDIDITGFDTVILGSPNWFGKVTPNIQDFIKINAHELKEKKMAVFFTCMSLTRMKADSRVFQDPQFDLVEPNATLTKWQLTHTPTFYVDQLNQIAGSINIESVAIFKGKLTLSQLNFTHRVIMSLICLFRSDINQGNFLDKKSIKDWVLYLSN